MQTMTIEGFFDGTTVRPVDTSNFVLNQKVYITIPSKNDEEKIKRQLNAINKLNGLLTEKESVALQNSLSERVSIKNRSDLV